MRDGEAARELAASLVPFVSRHTLVEWALDLPSGEGADWADLVRACDGARVRVTVGGWRAEGRAELRGMFPKFANGRPYYHGKSPAITCAAKRAPAAIAKEFVRRLLPEYEPAYRAARAFVMSHDRREDEAMLVARRIADSIGGTAGVTKSSRYGDGVSIHGEPDSVRRLTIHPAYGSGDEDLSRPVRVSFEAHDLDPDVALEVLRVIQAGDRRRVETTARVATPLDAVREELDEDEVETALRARARIA